MLITEGGVVLTFGNHDGPPWQPSNMVKKPVVVASLLEAGGRIRRVAHTAPHGLDGNQVFLTDDGDVLTCRNAAAPTPKPFVPNVNANYARDLPGDPRAYQNDGGGGGGGGGN